MTLLVLALMQLSAPAWAGCGVSLVAPVHGSFATDPPSFQWSGDCASYRLEVTASGWAGTTVRRGSALFFTPTAGAWDTWEGYGLLTGVLYWRVRGTAADGTAAATPWRVLVVPTDSDGDGSPSDEDCDDTDSAVSPIAPELCNGVDDDCDGLIDDDDDDVADGLPWYRDIDADGFGAASAASMSYACAMPIGYAAVSGDCDNRDASVNPDATEVCGASDDDCDGLYDEDDPDLDVGTLSTFYPDNDDDGAGDGTGAPIEACDTPPGYARSGTDCDDERRAIRPSATEMCNGIDDDCDGVVDDSCRVGTTIEDHQAFWLDVNNAAMPGVLDLDGRSDLMLFGAGEVYVYSHPVSGTLPADQEPDMILDGLPHPVVEPVGDLNDDGFEDLVLTSTNSPSGMYFVPGPLAHGSYDIPTIGHHVAPPTAAGFGRFNFDMGALGVGDENADGYNDVLAAGYYTNGVYLFHGPLESASDTADAHAFLSAVSEYDYPTELGAPGDMTGDGVPESAIGAFGTGDLAGSAYVFSEPIPAGTVSIDVADAEIFSTEADATCGERLDGGDLDADGYADLVIGCDGHRDARGAVYVVRGSVPAGDHPIEDVADLMITGDTAGDRVGNDTVVGDTDGDGALEIWVFAQYEDPYPATYVVPGSWRGRTSATDAPGVFADISLRDLSAIHGGQDFLRR